MVKNRLIVSRSEVCLNRHRALLRLTIRVGCHQRARRLSLEVKDKGKEANTSKLESQEGPKSKQMEVGWRGVCDRTGGPKIHESRDVTYIRLTDGVYIGLGFDEYLHLRTRMGRGEMGALTRLWLFDHR